MAKTADGDEEISRLLAMCAGRVILKRLNEGEKELPDEHTLRHIADWISAAVVTDAEWLSNLDADGRPKKLMKFSTIEQITAEADKAMRIANQRLFPVGAVADDEEIHQELEDGYVLVKMLAPSALDRESAAMQHCIGHGSYDFLLKSGLRTFLSLRDPAGKPHVTIEIDNQTNKVHQLQGKQNRAPIKRYIDILKPALENKYIVSTPTRLGYAIDEHGKWHDIYTLQNGMKFEGTLNISGTDLTELPRDLIVTGHLIANDTCLSELPPGLKVRGNVELRRSQIRRLGDAVKVNGNMDLSGSRMMILPNGLTVGGSLDLSNTKVWKLPSGLRVGHTLDISSTDISEIPEDIIVRVKLTMYRTDVETLPDSINDDLVVYRSPPKHNWFGKSQSDGCLAADMKFKPKPRNSIRKLFGFG